MSRIGVTPLSAAAERSAQLERAIELAPERFRVLTGDRPTGPLHVGHLFGTLANRVRLQDIGVEVLVLIADYQTLTDRDAPDSLPSDVLGQVADYLAVGVDPDRSTIFAHSQVEALGPRGDLLADHESARHRLSVRVDEVANPPPGTSKPRRQISGAQSPVKEQQGLNSTCGLATPSFHLVYRSERCSLYPKPQE